MNQKHIIDLLIEERAPKLCKSKFWPFLKPILNLALGYKKAVAMANSIKNKDGGAAIDFVSNLLSLQTQFQGFENLPQKGAVIIVANHPTGIADGIALYDVLKNYRNDMKFYANADALRICPKFSSKIIPIEWIYENRTHLKTRQTLLETQKTLHNEMALVIFPAGRLARFINGKLSDPLWSTSAVAIARKNNIPILPVKIIGPNAFWFHTFDKFSKELRDITLFHELLNKSGKTFILKAGPLINARDLDEDSTRATSKLKEYIENQL